MSRIYSNENFPLAVVGKPRDLGHDVLTVTETGRGGQAWPDDEVLAFAAKEQRVLITLNRKDFIRLHAKSGDHAGIVICMFDPDFERQARAIHKVPGDCGEAAGLLLRVNRPSSSP